jgi:hypothetical protein
MRLSAAVIKVLVAKGMSAQDILEIAVASETKADPTNAARQARFRTNRKGKSNAVTVTPVTPPNDNNTLTPVEVSEANASSPQPRPWALPAGVSLQVWTDFLTNRKRKRLPNTDTAWKSFNDDLARVSAQTGIPPPKLIERCTAKGWGAIYDPRDEGNGRTNGRNHSNDGLSSTARAAIAVFGPPGSG